MNDKQQDLNKEIETHSQMLARLRNEVSKVMVGQEYMIDRIVLALIADGHILIEGIPGLAKTTAVKTVSSDKDNEEVDDISKPTYVAKLETQIQEKEQRVRDVVSKHKLALTEFENVRARLSRDVGQQVETHKRSILAELLEVVDNLDRAVESGKTATDTQTLLEGVSMVRDQFLSKLESLGVKRLPSLGTCFDPEKHEAVSTVPANDVDQNGKVIGVIKEAYTIGDDILRHAVVAVGKCADASHAEENNDKDENAKTQKASVDNDNVQNRDNDNEMPGNKAASTPG